MEAPADTKTEETMHNSTRVYPAGGGWFYEVWIGARLVVFGWCVTRARAEFEAATA